MKTKNIIFVALLTALMAASCDQEYDYEKKERISEPAVLSLNVQNLEDTVALMSPKTKSYTVNVTASSIADEMLSLTVAADPSRVAAFNKEHGTSLEAVPGDAFELSSNTLMLPRYNTVSTTAQLTLKSSAMPEDGSLQVLALSITKVEGKDNISMTSSDSTVFILFRRKALPASGFELGTGTESDPYIIRNQLELISMVKGMKSGKTYFKMDADVDMSDYEDWTPLNAVAPYDMAVDFDGCGHTITGFNCSSDAYPSMFGVLVGSFRNVTFDNPVITAGASGAGLLGSQCGAADFPTEVKNVKVNNLRINMNGTAEGVGGLVGGIENKTDITIRRCYTSGDVSTLTSVVGGLVGFAKSSKLTDDNNFKMEHCIAWNKTLTNKVGNTWSSGGIIAVSNIVNTLTGNYRRPDMVLNDTDGRTLFDCADASPSTPLPYVDAAKYFYPYHGIAAPAGSTISSVAKTLAWPESVWDLSGDEPKLR